MPDSRGADDGGRDAQARRAGRDPVESPDSPSGWADFVRADYEYPDDFKDLSRRERRKAMRSWRSDDHAKRTAWLRDRRQAEPGSPVAAVVAVLLLAIIVLGIGGGLPKLLGRDDPDEPAVGLLTPAVPLTSEEPPDLGGSPTTPSTSQSSSIPLPPVVTSGPSGDAVTVASHVVNLWAHAFYTRNPAAETYEALVDKVATYQTAEVSDSLKSSGDPTYEALRADGGKSVVVAAPVTPPREGSAPVDTPTRISRLVTVTIDITGKTKDRIKLPLLVTLVPYEGKWLISEINGGTGP